MSTAAVSATASNREVRLLIVDDCVEDALLIAAAVNRDYASIVDHVNSPESFRQRLESGDYDVILCDHNLTTWTAKDALAILQESEKQTPFVVVTGTLGDERAVQYLKDGASDYVLKDRLDRLPAVIGRALREKSQREENARLQHATWTAKKDWERTFDAIPDSIMLLDPDCRILRTNRATAALLGLPFSQLIGRHCFELVHGTSAPPANCPFQQMVRTNQKEESERIEARLHKTLRIITIPLPNDTKTCGAIHVMQDVTESRHLQEALLQAQKLEAVGRLAGGVAHDFNNVLSVLLGYSELLQQQLPNNDNCTHYLQSMIGAVHRAEQITGQLLAFSRKQVMQATVFDLNCVVAGLTEMLHRLIGEDIELTVTPKIKLALVKADQSQIEQVLMNLVVNARDALSKGGRIEISTDNVYLNAQHDSRIHEEIVPDWYVSISVTDNGAGMAAETMSHIFEPFFTTKSKDKGTGLGLAIAYGIIKQSGGYISVWSEVGVGSTFTIYLPRTNEQLEPRNPEASPTKVLKRKCTETILVVEDEPDLAMVVNTVLTSVGYIILQAANAKEALRIAQGHEGEIDLMLTDVVLPGPMDGTELAYSLGRLRPHTKVLFMSGYSDSLVDRRQDNNDCQFLRKPFTVTELRSKVRERLSAQAVLKNVAASPG